MTESVMVKTVMYGIQAITTIAETRTAVWQRLGASPRSTDESYAPFTSAVSWHINN